MLIKLYTDGAAKGNPGPGGYGIVLEAGPHRKELAGGFRKTTNNRMELLAVIVGLEALKNEQQQVQVVSDSKYVVDAINKGWLKSWLTKNFKGKKNVDLWKRLLPMLQKHQVSFHWVKGHNSHPQNERCDTLAVDAKENVLLRVYRVAIIP
jgi:ribonuclease HI